MAEPPYKRPIASALRVTSGLVRRFGSLAGGCGLLAVMTLDASSAVGRSLGWPLPGAIELIEACIVVVVVGALIEATASGSHAAVSVVVGRLARPRRTAVGRASSLLSALFWCWLAGGSAWLAAELWRGHESSELLRLPVRPFRLFWCAGLVVVALLFLGRAMGSVPPGSASAPVRGDS